MSSSPEKAMEKMIENLKDKTGKSLEQWIKIVQGSNLKKHGEIIKFLKSEQKISHGYANLIAHSALKTDAVSMSETEDLVALQYAGEKAGLKPIYDKLVDQIKTFGSDVEISPKKAYVSLRRKKQFAIIQPSTKTRVDVGINLKNKISNERLEKSGSFNAMVSHRVRLSGEHQVDDQLIRWLREAYENA